MKKQRRYSTAEKEIIIQCFQNSESVSNIVQKINTINSHDKPVTYKSIHKFISRYKLNNKALIENDINNNDELGNIALINRCANNIALIMFVNKLY